MLEGDSFLYRAALAVLAVLETRLFFPDKRELLELLKYVSVPFWLLTSADYYASSLTGVKTKQLWK